MNVIHMDVTLTFGIVLDADAPNALTASEVKTRLQSAMCPTIKDWRLGLVNPVLVSDVAVAVNVAAPAAPPEPVVVVDVAEPPATAPSI